MLILLKKKLDNKLLIITITQRQAGIFKNLFPYSFFLVQVSKLVADNYLINT